MPGDIVAEAKRAPVVQGETGVEISARLIKQIKVKNGALTRAVRNYEACRAS